MTDSADPRLVEAHRWAADRLGQALAAPVPVSGDASFRRYFRVRTPAQSLILMDAPPAQENSQPFLDVARRLRTAGLNVPAVLHFDLSLGFGLLEDFGDCLYREVLNPQTADQHFPSLLACLAQMAQRADADGLPRYDDARLQAELDLFPDWYLARHQQQPLSAAEQREWNALCAALRSAAGEQPRTFVHRDFHSCNLLHMDGRPPGIIDFQDAVAGPVSYDLVSLIWDRYIDWPRERLEGWMESFRRQADIDADPVTWIRWCDLMGLQRNLKIVGIFARLHYRDQKIAYLPMIPRFYQYLLDVLPRYPEFAGFLGLLRQRQCAQ